MDNKKKVFQNGQKINSEVIDNQNIVIPFTKRVFSTLKDGIFAFSVILILLSLSKLLALSTNSIGDFIITINDIIYSFWAFAIVTSIEIISYRKS